MIFVKKSTGGRREGGQHDQHCVKNKFVKNRVVNLKLDNVFKYTVCFFWMLPLRYIVFERVIMYFY